MTVTSRLHRQKDKERQRKKDRRERRETSGGDPKIRVDDETEREALMMREAFTLSRLLSVSGMMRNHTKISRQARLPLQIGEYQLHAALLQPASRLPRGGWRGHAVAPIRRGRLAGAQFSSGT